MEQLANNPTTTLNGAITNTATSLTVTSAVGFSGNPDFTIHIESELLRVTGVSSNTFTVVRGQEGTTAAAHADTTPVKQVVTANSLTKLFAEMTQVGPYASRPTLVRAGTEYRANDIDLGWRYNGTSWDLNHPFYVPSANKVNVSGWTNMNLVHTTWTDINGVLVAQVTSNSGDGIRGKYHAIPSAPFNAYCIVGPTPIHQSETQHGIVLYATGTTKAKVFGMQSYDNGSRVVLQNWNSPTSFNANLVSNAHLTGGYPFIYVRFYDDNTNWHYYVSQDGQHWVEVFREARNSFVTPDSVGLYVFRNSNPTSYDDYMTFYGYWEA